MASWLLLVVIVNIVQSGLSISSLSYHPDYSKLSIYNLVVILGALINVIITLIVITVLFIMKPKVLVKDEDKQILQIPSDKKQLDKLFVDKTKKDWEFFPIQISATSTDSKTGEEPTLTQIAGTDDYFKAIPELPQYVTHIEGGQPVVFHFIEKKPGTAILPVYIVKRNESESMPRTLLKTSGSERKELERSLTKSNEIQTARSLSAKKDSSSSSVTKKTSSIRKTIALDDNAGKKSEKATASLTKSVDEGDKTIRNKSSTKSSSLPSLSPLPKSSPTSSPTPSAG